MGAGFLAAILVFISSALVVRASVNAGTRINGNTLALATFTITYAVSAFVHLTGANYVSEGFYDFASLDPRTQAHHVYLTLALVVLAQIGLWYGLSPTRQYPVSTRVHTLRVRTKLLVFVGIAFSALGFLSTFLFFRSQGGSIEEITTVDRARDIAVGTARFAFMSAWLSWGITFLLSAFVVSRTSSKRPRLTILTLLLGSACILLNMLWTGGRAENLLAIAPLVYVVKRCAPRVFRAFTFAIVLVIVAVIVFQTLARTSGFLGAGMAYLDQAGVSKSQFVSNQVAAILDWQMGRYGTIGLVIDMAKHFGYAFGSTLFQGIAMTLNVPATLLRVDVKIFEPQAITSIAGEYLFSDPTINGVVPGTVAELYFNFGILGVLGGFFVIGRTARFCIRVVSLAGDMSTLLLGFYSLLLICIWTIPMTATLTFYFLVTRGFPILVLFGVERMLFCGRRVLVNSQHSSMTNKVHRPSFSDNETE